MIRITDTIGIDESEIEESFVRSSGPGGQSVNTADSRVELSLDIGRTTSLGPVQRARALERLRGRLVDGVLTVRSSAQRSQLQNREAARKRLAAVLAIATTDVQGGSVDRLGMADRADALRTLAGVVRRARQAAYNATAG